MRPERALVVTLALLMGGCASSGGAPSRSAKAVSREARDAAELQVKLGQGYLSEGQLETARDKLRRALELDPNSADAHTLMAVLSERINRPEQAGEYYKRAAELKHEDGGANNNYATYLCRQRRFEEAERHFQIAFRDPFYRTPAVAYGNAGMCATQAGDTARAEAYLRKAIELEPNSPTVLLELARIHFDKGDPLRARAFMQRFEARGGNDPTALVLAARIEDRLGDERSAGEYRQRLKQAFPDYQPPSAETN